MTKRFYSTFSLSDSTNRDPLAMMHRDRDIKTSMDGSVMTGSAGKHTKGSACGAAVQSPLHNVPCERGERACRARDLGLVHVC